MNLDAYCQQLTLQVFEHGHDQIMSVDDLKTWTFGFSSPTGYWEIRLSEVKAAFATGEWREDTSLKSTYEALGGKTPLTAITRLPPKHVVAALFGLRIAAAIQEGERLRAAPKAEA